MCNALHVMSHMSRITCNVSLIFFLLFFYKVVKLGGGGSVINRGLPCVVLEPIMVLGFRKFLQQVTICQVPSFYRLGNRV